MISGCVVGLGNKQEHGHGKKDHISF